MFGPNVNLEWCSMSRKIIYLPFLTISLMTIFVNPWTAPDPINQPKLFVGLLGIPILIPFLVKSLRTDKPKNKKAFLIAFFLILLCVMLSTIFNVGEIWEKLWGVFGRSTGALAYLVILSSLLVGFAWGKYIKADLILMWIIRTGYIVSSYAILQIAELDPILWESRGQVGFSTLGNINYVSAFLGMTSSAMLTYVVSKDRPLTSRLWFALVCILNFWIFIVSGSLQGFLVLFTGISSLFLIQYKRNLNRKVNWPALVISYLTVWLITFVGLAGIGPLGALIKQDTMIFRADYWKAGMRMILDSPWLGKGPDSYGMYYREFRDYAATYRTEPGRTSNSAHSVLIDIGVSYGVIAVVALLMIICLVYRQVTNSIDIFTSNGISSNSSYSAVVAISGGFLSTLTFSISQIAIMSWGFLIWGWLAQGSSGLDSKVARSSNVFSVSAGQSGQQSDVEVNHFQVVFMATLLLLITIFLVAPRLTAEREFKSALKKPDIQFIESKSEDSFMPIGYGYLALDTVISLNLLEPSLVIAQNLVSRNPREYVAWTIIARHPNSTPKDQSIANQRLRELDPLNEEHQ